MKTVTAMIGAALVAAALFTSGCGGTAATKYTCPMHADVVQDQPGNCPTCGMKLVEKH